MLNWEDADLPPPNWIAVNPKNGYAHYGYLLETPVITSVRGPNAPRRFLAPMKAACRLELGSDPALDGPALQGSFEPKLTHDGAPWPGLLAR